MSNAAMAGEFAAVGLALYAGHNVGDYWVQTAHQSMHKGDEGDAGRLVCVLHIISYLITQLAMLVIATLVLGLGLSALGVISALLVSGLTHYMADRREHNFMIWLAHKLPFKRPFLTGASVVRAGGPVSGPVELSTQGWDDCPTCDGAGYSGDQAVPNGGCWDCRGGGRLPVEMELRVDREGLGTGAWALDQSWHIFWGVFVAGLLAVAL